MSSNKGYEDSENGGDVSEKKYIDAEEKIYTYDEAIDLTGTGVYNVCLLATVTLGLLAMALDMFGISVVLPAATCDFHLDLRATGVLLSATFIGPIIMAYPWGYISDTKGRKKSLAIALWISFIVSMISALSPNWTTMAVLKFISTCFSSCAQSASYTLLGESCSKKVRDMYMLIMSGVLDLCLAVYVGLAYVVINNNASFDLGFMNFASWRTLTVVLTLPLGIAAIGIQYFCESPKFLLNLGAKEETLNNLKRIWRINGCPGKVYPVKRIDLNEEGNERRMDVSLLQSLWDRVAPLFKPPLLWRSLQLYFLIGVIYGTNNSYYIWFPFLAENFVKSLAGNDTMQESSSLCSLIVGAYNNNTETVECSTTVSSSLFWTSLIQGASFAIILMCITIFANKKRLVVVVFLLISSVCAVGAVAVRHDITSFVLFIGFFLNEIIIGCIYSYFVELYPTSYRGMAACLATMVARGSALGATNLLGIFIVSHCAHTFYITSVIVFAGVIVAWFLPKSVPQK